MKQVFGRTNENFPKKWASLGVPDGGFSDFSPSDLVSALKDRDLPICIASQPALWGGCLRGGSEVLLQSGTLQIENATSEDHASDLVQAHLIETLSSLGRETIDFYFLRIRRALEEFQINGALAALEFAKQEGHIRFLGLRADGPAMSVLGFWQFHDAFEAIWVPSPVVDRSSFDMLSSLAKDRRAGVLATNVTELAYGLDLVDIDRSAALEAITKQCALSSVLVNIRSMEDLDSIDTERSGTVALDEFTTGVEEESFWDSLRASTSPRVIAAVRGRDAEE